MTDNGGNGKKGYIVAPPQQQWAYSKGHSGTIPVGFKSPHIEFNLDNRPPIQFCLACLRDFLYTNDVGQMLVPSGQKDEGTVDDLMEHDLRVVISRNLLEAHGVTLHAGTWAPVGMFWFPVPTAAPSDHAHASITS